MSIQHAELMTGDPEPKQSAPWINEIKSNQLGNAPLLSGTGTIAYYTFGSDWNKNQCGNGVLYDPTDQDFNPPEVNFNQVPSSIPYHMLVDGHYQVHMTAHDDKLLDAVRAAYGSVQIVDEKDIGVNQKEYELLIPVTVPPKKLLQAARIADIVFIFDTSGSMEDNIDNVKANIQEFINYFKSHNIEAYMGVMTTWYDGDIVKHNLLPADQVNIDDVHVDGRDKSGLEEEQGWRSFTDSNYGLPYFYSQFHSNSIRHCIMLTDARFRDDIPNDLISALKSKDVIVSMICDPNNNKSSSGQAEFTILSHDTGGKEYDIFNANFSDQMLQIADQIVNSAIYGIDDTSITVSGHATDLSGNEGSNSTVLNFHADNVDLGEES